MLILMMNWKSKKKNYRGESVLKLKLLTDSANSVIIPLWCNDDEDLLEGLLVMS